MALIWPIIWSFIKAYWKPLVITGAIISIALVIYLRGRSDMQHKIERRDLKETIRRDAEVHKVVDRANKVREKIRILDKNGQYTEKDRVYSCLLSNDPISTSCN